MLRGRGRCGGCVARTHRAIFGFVRNFRALLGTCNARLLGADLTRVPAHRRSRKKGWRRGLCWRRTRGRGVFEFLDRDGYLLVAPIHQHQHKLREDLTIEHRSPALGGLHAALLPRQLGPQFVVRLVFVAKAAHQSPATPADLQRVERRFLNLGRLHAHWLEHLEELFTAAVLAAAFIVGGQAGLIACPDLSQLDPRMVDGGKLGDQLAEVDTVFTGEVERDLVAAQDRFGIHNLHIEVHPLRDSAGLARHLRPGSVDSGLLVQVFGGGDAEHLPLHAEEGVVAAARVLDVFEHLLARHALGAPGVRAGAGEHLAQFGAAMRLDDHF